jgi:hypothetical protein
MKSLDFLLPENIRDFFEPGGSNSITELLFPIRQMNWEAEDIEFIDALLTLSRVVIKTERNKSKNIIQFLNKVHLIKSIRRCAYEGRYGGYINRYNCLSH